MKINFGEILQSVIKQNNLTQKEVANALHITPQCLNSYIHNRRVPDLVIMRHILQYFQLDANIVLQIELKEPREYVTPQEQYVLHTYRKLNNNCKKTIMFLLETFTKL